MKLKKSFKKLYHVMFFIMIDCCFTLYILLTVSAFLTYQWFVNLNSSTILYYYDTMSVLWFSILISTILTKILYRPLLSSIWFQPLWDKINDSE